MHLVARRRHERETVPVGNVSGATNLAGEVIRAPKVLVAHALLRAASPLLATPLDSGKPRCRHECRHGTQECVRHVRPSLSNDLQRGLWKVPVQVPPNCVTFPIQCYLTALKPNGEGIVTGCSRCYTCPSCTRDSGRIASLKCLRGNMSKKAVLRAALLLSLICVSVFAQRDLGTIVGTVTDPQGGAIPNAKVTITEDATGLSYRSTDQFIRRLCPAGSETRHLHRHRRSPGLPPRRPAERGPRRR